MPPDHDINGERLRTTRLAQSRTLHQVGHDLTLSTNQILELEDGGMRCFYNRHYKLLCARRYAQLLGLAVEEVIATDTPKSPEHSPAPKVEPSKAPDDEAAPATAKKEETPTHAARSARKIAARSALVAALAAIVGAAAYMGTESLPAPSADMPVARTTMPMVDASPAQAKKEAIAAQESPAGAVTPIASVNLVAETNLSVPALVSEPPPAPQAVPANKSADCPDVPQPAVEWQTAYPRKPGSRVYVTATSAIVLCIFDARHRVQVAHLRTAQTKSFAGTPPFVIAARGGELSAQAIYFQGMRVRAGKSAQAVKLVERTAE